MSREALSPQQAMVLESVKQFPGLTAAQLAVAVAGDVHALRRRLPELHRMGKIMRDNDARYWAT